jgi:hypothetical protein
MIDRETCKATRNAAAGVRHLVVLLAALAACGDDPPAVTTPDAGAGARFPTSSVVLGQDSQTTYLSFLQTLDNQVIDLGQARELAGWADLWVHEGKVFMTDGSAPSLTRYSVNAQGQLIEDGRLSFLNHGAESAAFWTNLFISPTKAYLFIMKDRLVVTWNPTSMEITGTFPLPGLEDRGALTLQVPSTDRSSVVRGNRAYVPTVWANWKDYALSEDSVILVIDTATDHLVGTTPVSCPNINVATVDDQTNIYFSNWVFSVAPTLLDGKARACAVRIKAGSDQLDPTWSLTFADVTNGREAAALRFIGDGKALMSVFHHERAQIEPTTDRYALVESANWSFWTIDLATREAKPTEGIGWHAGGFYSTRIDRRNLLFVPSADYASTVAYEMFPNGTTERRWDTKGWATRLFKLN